MISLPRVSFDDDTNFVVRHGLLFKDRIIDHRQSFRIGRSGEIIADILPHRTAQSGVPRLAKLLRSRWQ